MSNTLSRSSLRTQQLLHDHNITTTVREFSQLTRTAQEAADAIGCEVGQIAKSLIFKGKNTGTPLCVIASGTNRVDEKKIEQLIGEAIEKPDADYVMHHTGFVIGGIPPIGYHFAQPPLIDEDLLKYSHVWAAAGTPNSVFCISPDDLIRITQAKVVAVKKR
jgi:prolyl-tRNA editing enzyme YbaK/EbsC (Cys-tRNA(Pro) deacylase)